MGYGGIPHENFAHDGAGHFGGIPFGKFAHDGGGPMGGTDGANVDNTMLYETLGVRKDASAKDIRKAYHKLSREHHPDKGGDENKYKEINAAYEVLSDEDLRRRYDTYGLDGVKEDNDGSQEGMGVDLFRDLFGGGRARNRPKRGPNVNHPLKVSLEDLYKGKTTKLAINRKIIVGDPSECATCQGRGSKIEIRELGPGMVTQIQRPCDECKGQGYVAETKSERKVVEVYIEKGMENGQKVVLRNMADEVPNIEPGDVNLIVTEKEHELFRRKGADLLVAKELSLNQALCGFSWKITHLDGRQILIKSKPGEVVRPQSSTPFLTDMGMAQPLPFVKVLPNEGMPSRGNPFVKGNLYVLFHVKFPEDNELDEDTISILRKALPDADMEGEYDAEEVEEVNLSHGNVLDFGKGGAPSKGNDAYDSDEEGGVPQCQQS